MENQKNNVVIIATSEVQKALLIIGKEAVLQDRIEIQYNDSYEQTIEYLLRILRKGFGWLEDCRGEKEIVKAHCVHSKPETDPSTGKRVFYCSGPCKGSTEYPKICNRQTQKSCEHYKTNPTNTMIVHYVIIEKVGAIKGL
jgi:hypothetical protein